MKLAVAVLVLISEAISVGQNPAIRRPFKSDPPIMCSACPGWNGQIDPFKVFGNTYYVGTKGLSSVLVTSDRGHVLLDGGLPQSAELIDRNIRVLGFRLDDVELIVSSHAHYDHAGGIHALQVASGARVAASKGTADALKRGDETPDDPQVGFGRAATEFPSVRKVQVVRDGEVLRVGPLAITAHLTPGHTPGSTTWTWQSCEGARCLDIVYADSLNAISAPGFRYSADPARVALFKRSIETVASLPCDIVISVHPDLTNVLEKLAAKNFVAKGGCRDYAANATRILDARLASE